MNTQAFIFNWKGQTARAVELEHAVGRLAKVQVINSAPDAPGDSNWIHLGDSAYFSAQWNMLLNSMKAETEIIFHIQADVEFNDFPRLFERAEHAFRSYSTGVYEPKISRPSKDYDTSRLRCLEERVFEVPLTDTTCWFIAAPVLRNFPRIDVNVNRFGWGVAATVAALVRQAGHICVKDYSFMVHHPSGRGYAASVAKRQEMDYINGLKLSLAVDIVRVILDRQRLMQR